jgi:predicted amidohydrolase YtcJ
LKTDANSITENMTMLNELSQIIADRVYGSPAGSLQLIRLSLGEITSITDITAEEAHLVLAAGHAATLDLRGLTLLPGLIDAHVHAIASGMLLLGADLHDATTLEQVAAAAQAGSAAAGDYIRLGGLDLSRLVAADAARLDRVWLDALAPARPLIIKSVEGHSSWFSSVAWERLGIGAVLEQCAVPRAEAARMWQSGRVYGEAYEKLANPIYDTYTAQERREGLRRVLERAAQAGLTGIHCLEGYGARRREDFELIRELDGSSCHLTLYARDDNPRLARELGLTRFGGCWCVDGAIGSHTAALSESYADQPGCLGDLYYSTPELSAWIEAGLAAEMQVCVHAIGDRALEQVVGIYEQLAGRYDLARLRPRVDHFILGTTGLAQRAARLGLCSAMQPAFDARWGGTDGGYATRLGPQRALQTNPVGGMLRAGLRVAGSSDSYITPLDPLGGIRAAANHHNPEQRIDLDTAVELFTSNAAYLAHQEQHRGKLVPGYSADFTAVSGELGSAQQAVACTIVAGRVVYRA